MIQSRIAKKFLQGLKILQFKVFEKSNASDMPLWIVFFCNFGFVWVCSHIFLFRLVYWRDSGLFENIWKHKVGLFRLKRLMQLVSYEDQVKRAA